jgi:hypothetical protein
VITAPATSANAPCQRLDSGHTCTDNSRHVPSRIPVVDNHPEFRAGLRAMLAAQPDTQVIGEAATGGQAVKAVAGKTRRRGLGPGHAGHARAIEVVVSGAAIFCAVIARQVLALFAGNLSAGSSKAFPQLTDRDTRCLSSSPPASALPLSPACWCSAPRRCPTTSQASSPSCRCPTAPRQSCEPAKPVWD